MSIATAASEGSSPQTAAHRGRTWGALLAVLIVAVALIMLLGGGSDERSIPLDPENPRRFGGQAIARVLDRDGVNVVIARSADALEAQEVGADTTIVVTSTENLGTSTIKRLTDYRDDAQLILVEPSIDVLAEFDPALDDDPDSASAPAYGPLDRPRPGNCSDQRFDDLKLEVDIAASYQLDSGCFGGDQGVLLGTLAGSNSRGSSNTDITVLGAGQILENEQITRADNAAIALRLLGQGTTVIWYVPDLADLKGSDGKSLWALLPQWVRPGLFVVAIAAIALVVNRGRRLGPLVREPTPVEVKAIETTLGRGRLYRKAHDRAHAAAILRRAAREKLRVGLHLAAWTPHQALVRSVGEHLGRPVSETAALIDPDAPQPTTDHQLIDLANRLAELDEEVRRT